MCQVVISTVKTQIFFSIYAPVLFIIIFLVSMYQRSLSTALENYVIPKHQPSPIWKVSNDSTSSPKPQIYENFAKSFLTSAALFRNFGGWWTSHLFDRSIRAYSRQAVADFRIEYVSMLFSCLAQRWHGVGVLCMCELGGVLSVC